MAKIERRGAIENFDEILKAADAVMIARGDLGVEIPIEEVPGIQKRLIQKANIMGRPVITATQMLESMTQNVRPTRAEVNDVANAILDGTDAIMLSQETAIGDYPVETVRMMAKIAMTTENQRDEGQLSDDEGRKISHKVAQRGFFEHYRCHDVECFSRDPGIGCPVYTDTDDQWEHRAAHFQV